MPPMLPPAARLIACLALLFTAVPASAAETEVVFRNVNVLPMDRPTLLRGQDVVVRDGRIVAIQATGGDPPVGATVIDGRDRYLMPGLADLHTHPVAPREFPLYLRHGVTTILAAGGEPLEWDRVDTLTAAPLQVLSTTDTLHGRAGPGGYVVSSPDDAADVVGQAHAAGASLLKTYTSMTGPTLEALSRQARARGMAVVGHLPAGVPLDQALPWIDLVAHSEEFAQRLPADAPPADIDAAIAALVRHRTWVAPTLAVVERIGTQVRLTDEDLRSAEAGLLPAPVFHGWHKRNNRYANRERPDAFAAAVAAQLERQRDFVRRLHRAGVPLLFGTDSPTTCLPGSCVHLEFAELAGAGLDNFEALRTATANAGRFVTERSRAAGDLPFGVIAPGAAAHLLLLESNPLQDLAALRSVAGVMSQGQWLPRQHLDRLVADYRRDEARRHALVRRYERLTENGDVPARLAALSRSPGDGTGTLNPYVVMNDAQALMAAGHPEQATALVAAARQHFAPTLATHHLVADYLAKAGDTAAALAEYRRSLALAPRNGYALDAIRALEPAATALTPEAEVTSVVNGNYLAGFRDGNLPAMQALFAEGGVHVLHGADGEPAISVTPLAARLPGWASHPDPLASLTGLRVLCTSDRFCVASFTLHYRGRRFEDQLNMVRTGGRWQCVAKVTRLP